MKIRSIVGILSFFALSPVIQAASLPASNTAIVKPPLKSTNQINLNTADAATLSKSMKGIGIKRAEAIIKYREAHDGFKSIDELAQVPRLGSNFVKNHSEELQRIFIITK